MTEELEEHWRIALTPEERGWESSLSLSRLELVKIFPESKEILKEMIKDADDRFYFTRQKFNEVGNYISANVINFKEREFLMDLCRMSVDEDLDYYEKKIKDANLLLSFTNKRKPVGGTLDIEKAKQFPIPDLLEFNRAGFAKCIFSQEKTASMKYYPKTNSVYCFGCNKKADAIDIAQEIYKISFKEAVNKLCTY